MPMRAIAWELQQGEKKSGRRRRGRSKKFKMGCPAALFDKSKQLYKLDTN
jgi:hypothetical protein